MIVHHHLIYQGHIRKANSNAEELECMLYNLVKEIDMQVLIPPMVEYSHQKAWTGLIGIITSHISFHYWTYEKYVQMDIYSCKPFDIEKALKFMDDFWMTEKRKALFITRNPEEEFGISKYDK